MQNETMRKASLIFALALLLVSSRSLAQGAGELSLEEKISRQMKMIEMGVSLSPEMNGVSVGSAVKLKKSSWAKYQALNQQDTFCILPKGSLLEVQGFTSDSQNALALFSEETDLFSKKETRATQAKGQCRTGQVLILPLKALR